VLKSGDELSNNDLNRVGTHTRVHFLLLRGIANIGIGEYTSAWELTTAACATDDSMRCTHENSFAGSDPAIVARGYATYSGLALGYLDRCLLLIEETLAIARKRNHAFTVGWALLAASRIYREVGRFTDALSTGEEAIELCERHGFVARLGTVLLQTGGTHCRLGETERGLTETRRGLELWRRTSSRLHTCPIT
jgi:hypothetical protein